MLFEKVFQLSEKHLYKIPKMNLKRFSSHLHRKGRACYCFHKRLCQGAFLAWTLLCVNELYASVFPTMTIETFKRITI